MSSTFLFRFRLRHHHHPRSTNKSLAASYHEDEQPVKNTSPLLTLSKRLSKRWRAVCNSSEDDDVAVNHEPNVAKLLLVLEHKQQRNELVNRLLCGSADVIIKIRFCIATGEYAKVKDKHEKRAKGRKIVGLFIQNGSMFCLDGVPYSMQQTLLGGKDHMFAECFKDLRNLFAQELASQRQVLDALRQLDNDNVE